MRVRACAAFQKKVALMLKLSLAFDALREDFVGRLDVDKNAGIIRVRRDFHESPDNGERVIAVTLRRARIAVRLAGAMNDAASDAPGFHRVGVGSHAKRPAGKILAVEKFDAICRRDDFLRGTFCEREDEAK